MHHYGISLDGESVGVRSKTDLSSVFVKWKKLLHFTGVQISSNNSHEFAVEYIDAPGNEVRYVDKEVYITMPFDKLQMGEMLLYVALPFVEVLLQRKQIVTMHAAAIEFDGRGILLLGKAGAGKTSLTLALCRNHRAKLIGNDIVKVGLVDEQVVAYSGSQYFFLRQESIKRNIPDLLSLFPKSEKDPWTHKIHLLPDSLGISICSGQVPIARSYLVHVDETMECPYVVCVGEMDIKLYLNENMSRYIRGTAVSLFDEESHFMGYVPSFDTPDFFAGRVKLMESLISQTEMMYLSGSLKDASQYIVSTL